MNAVRPTAVASPTTLIARRSDVALGAIFLLLMFVEIWVLLDLPWAGWQQVAATVLVPGVAVPVAFRSSHPVLAFAVNTPVTIALIALDYHGSVYQWANLLLLFGVAATCVDWRAWVSFLVSALGALFFVAKFEDGDLGIGILVLAMWSVVWMFGRVQGVRRRELELRTDRDLATARANEQQAQLQLEEQRTAMARELHDLIGHTVNVMVVHAGAGRRAVPTNPEVAEQAFQTIESTGRAALDELDRVLGILRSDPETPLAPLPGISDLPRLIDDLGSAGLDVELRQTGEVDQIPSSVGATVYRVVQEAVTNTIKHAEATKALVTISHAAGAVKVAVSDNGIGVNEPADNNRRGLAGIEERVRLHGGTATFGNGPDGGFQVECSLPLSTPGTKGDVQ